ncbi:hypothetical protein CGRA01v4_11742 [Colletotrichum graminicola]|nr:hypothetical protein CGRA01v4_11742 [Colletotrichum graminicola]
MVIADSVAQTTVEQLQWPGDRELPPESIEFIKQALLEDRQGVWTCTFLGGGKNRQTKCFLLKRTGGYCSLTK